MESHLTLSFNNFQYEYRLFDAVLYQCTMSTNAHKLQPFFHNYKCFEREINSIFQLLHFIYHSLLSQNRNLTEFYIVSHIRALTHTENIYPYVGHVTPSIPSNSSRINIRHTTYVTYIVYSMMLRMECDNCRCVRILLMRTSQLIEINIVCERFKIAIAAFILLREWKLNDSTAN